MLEGRGNRSGIGAVRQRRRRWRQQPQPHETAGVVDPKRTGQRAL